LAESDIDSHRDTFRRLRRPAAAQAAAGLGNNLIKFPSIVRECARSVGDFIMSLPFASLRVNRASR
jgi:hypothetical protein